MGTSSPFGGPGNNTPLLPDWADDFDFPSIPETVSPDGGPTDLSQPSDQVDSTQIGLPGTDGNQAEPSGEVFSVSPSSTFEPYRFRNPRSNFTRYVRSNGTDKNALGRAIGGYVSKGAGGANTAARRMSKSAASAGRLLGTLRDIQRVGLDIIVRSLSLESLANRSPKEILIAFTEAICSPGGPIDESVARDAFVETIISTSALGEDLMAITEEQICVLTSEFITHSITQKMFVDIGQAIDLQALSGEQAEYLTQSAYGFVLGLVQDRILHEIRNTRNFPAAKLQSVMRRIYEVAYRQLELEYGEL